MRKFTRRLTAAVLSACLAMAPMGALAEWPMAPVAQVELPAGDGMQMMLPVQSVIASTGETVYWLDISMLSEDQVAALGAAQMMIYDEGGELMGQYLFGEIDEGMVELHDAIDPEVTVPMMIAFAAMPETAEEAEAVMAEYGLRGSGNSGGRGNRDDRGGRTEGRPGGGFNWQQNDRWNENNRWQQNDHREQEEAARIEAERLAAEEAARIEAERLAAEEAARIEAERLAAEEAARIEAERLAAEEAARIEAERLAAEEAARIEAERLAAEEAARIEAERLAAEEAARIEAERLAAEEAALAEIVQPGYVVPFQDNTNLRSEPLMEENVIMQLSAGEVLVVNAHAVDAEGRTWWYVQDYRTGEEGFVMADVVGEVSENIFQAYAQQIEAERLAAEEAARIEAERLAAEEAARIEAERLAAEEAARIEAERLAAEEAARIEAERLAAEEAARIEAERLAAEEAARIEAERLAAEEAARIEAERLAAEEAARIEAERLAAEEAAKQEQQNTVRYAVTSNRNNPTNNLRRQPSSRSGVVGEYANGELVIVGEPSDDYKWYEVTVVRDGAQGYMRDYLLTEISQADAQARLDELEGKNNNTQDHYPELIVPDQKEDDHYPELIVPDEKKDDNYPELIVPGADLIDSFPAYAMTLEQENGAMIVLRTVPGGELPQDGAIPMIREPSPLELTQAQLDAQGNGWYLVRNMNNGETGYIESHKIEEVTREEAEAAVKPVVSVIPPVPSDDEETEDGDQQEETAPQEPELIVPDIPQELTEGDIYHYGRNTGRQVGLRQEPSTKAKRLYNMEQGTVLWVMSREGDWCHVRTDRAEGYVMAEYVKLMDVNEEAAYRNSIDDPEVAPERDDVSVIEPQETSLVELITPRPTATPTPEPAEPTPTPAPQEFERYALITRNGTQLHASPSDKAYLQAMLNKEDVVYAMHSVMNDDGESWVLVQVDAQWGYVLSSHLQMMTDEEQHNYLLALEAAKATPTPTATPTATPMPTKTPAPQRLELYARVLNDGTPLRGNPDPNAYLQTILGRETVVYLFQSQIAEDGMMWYLVQFNGMWGYIRADLVRPMGERETADYLAQLEAELATPTPMPQVTPEPVGPDSTSAYAKLIKDKVNLRRTPSLSGTSLDRVPQNTLLLVLGSEYDGTYTWYQVNYDGKEGYIRSDMAQMLTISELTDYYKEQMEASKPGANATPNKNNTVDVVINGSPLQDLIPVDGSWTNNVVSGMPSYATATPDPNATPTPQPPAKLAALIRFSGDMTVNNVPALTQSASFSVYGKTKAYTTVTATVEVTVETPAAGSAQSFSMIASAIAENAQTVKKTVGQAVADKDGRFEMNVTLPGEGEYIVEFANSEGAFAQYGVTYDDGATPVPVPTATAQPLPTAMPVEEESGMGIWPFVIGGLLIAIAAAVYGVYIYRRRMEEEEDEENEDEEDELRQAQLSMQRQRAASAAQKASAAPKAPTSTVIPGSQRAPRAPQSAQGDVPSYMRNTEAKTPVSPYARPAAPQIPSAPVAPSAPKAPVAPKAPSAPVAPQAPVAPKAPAAPVNDEPEQVVTATRRRRRPPVDPNA